MLNLYEINESVKFQIEKGIIKEEDWKLGRRIRFIRKQLKQTQDEFAKILKVSKSSLQNYESGKKNISSNTLQQIIKDFKVNSSWLLMDKGDMFSNTLQEDFSSNNQPKEDSLLIDTFSELYSELFNLYKTKNQSVPMNLKEIALSKAKNIINITKEKDSIEKMIKITLENELN